jgi:quercetin dioxygenase-like cupin family protein
MTEWISGNIFIRPNQNMKKGDVIQGHKHNFDHTSFVTEGSVHVKAVTPDGRVIESDFGKDYKYRHFLVLADVEHEITALEDGTNFYCIYSHRTPQGEVSISQTGWREAYV